MYARVVSLLFIRLNRHLRSTY